jgi:hypothetical protein
MKTRTSLVPRFATFCLALLIPAGCDVPNGPVEEIGVPAVTGPRQCPKGKPGRNITPPLPTGPIALSAGEPLGPEASVDDDCQPGARANPRGNGNRIVPRDSSAALTAPVATIELPPEWPELRAWFAGRSAQPVQ